MEWTKWMLVQKFFDGFIYHIFVLSVTQRAGELASSNWIFWKIFEHAKQKRLLINQQTKFDAREQQNISLVNFNCRPAVDNPLKVAQVTSHGISQSGWW